MGKTGEGKERVKKGKGEGRKREKKGRGRDKAPNSQLKFLATPLD